MTHFFSYKLYLCPMTISFFLTISDQTDLLKHQIASIIQQSQSTDELYIIDSSGDEKNCDRVTQMQTQASFVIEHLQFKPTDSFAKQLNTAIHRSKGDFLILVNEHGFLHPKLIQHHRQFSKRGLFLHGVVSKTITLPPLSFSENFQSVYKKVRASGNAFYFPLRSHFCRPKSFFAKENEIQNISFWREDFNLINGYDEDFHTPSYTQFDFLSRLTHLGVKSKSLKGAAFFYQPNKFSKGVPFAADEKLLEKSLMKKRIVALNGVEKD